MRRYVILIADADGERRLALRQLLSGHGYDVLEAVDKPGCLLQLKANPPDLALLGSSPVSPEPVLEIAREIRRSDAPIPVVLIASKSSEDLVVDALRAGVTDYFRHPVSSAELLSSLARCLARTSSRRGGEIPGAAGTSSPPEPRMIGNSDPMRAIDAQIDQLASVDCTVMITGETGTGKELAAELIHRRSPRRNKPFVCIDCAAIPGTLFEGELFGSERGAFTGALTLRKGELELAEGGTAVLDEIGDLNLEAQAKLLRSIERKEVRRLGGKAHIPLDVRVIAATNQDPERQVAEGKFRKDLYFRLNVARIHIPPLRERKEDIPLLAGYYVGELNRRFGRQVEGLSDEVMASLLGYEWPGNVRELRNLLEAVFVGTPARRVTPADLPDQFRRALWGARAPSPDEREQLLAALFSTRWNKTKAARKLHVSRVTLYRRMTKYRIAKADVSQPVGGAPSPEKS